MRDKLYLTIVGVMISIFIIPAVSLANSNEELIKIADEYLVSRLGEEYFDKYINFRFVSSSPEEETSLPDPMVMVYVCYFHKVTIGINQPDIGYDLDMPIYVQLNSKDEKWEVTASNIPGCLEGDKNCNPFKITKKEAFWIADEYNIVDDCPRGWFIQEPKYIEDSDSFVWEIDCLKNLNQTSIKVHIDAATGEIKYLMGYSTRGREGTIEAFK